MGITYEGLTGFSFISSGSCIEIDIGASLSDLFGSSMEEVTGLCSWQECVGENINGHGPNKKTFHF